MTLSRSRDGDYNGLRGGRHLTAKGAKKDRKEREELSGLPLRPLRLMLLSSFAAGRRRFLPDHEPRRPHADARFRSRAPKFHRTVLPAGSDGLAVR